VTLTCRPVQKPHPPIWFAANNDAAVRRAAPLGDTWFVNPHATMASITRQMGLYREELARLGKPLPRVRPLIKEIYCAKDRRTALELAGPYLGAKYRAYASWGQDAVLPDGDTFRQRSRRSCVTASCSAALRNATSSCVRAGKRSARTSSSFARTGSACHWPTRWRACGS
jgi:alkanesulfonate monooxygenase SsuD/methylene tetrahydromethanopterin reductase-like flavin-dependent oxidoreductase (luciferase family)